MNLTKFASSIVATPLFDVLRMAFVESGNSAESVDYLVGELAVANSQFSLRLLGSRSFCPSVILVRSLSAAL